MVGVVISGAPVRAEIAEALREGIIGLADDERTLAGPASMTG